MAGLTALNSPLLEKFKVVLRAEIAVPIVLLMMLAMMILPIPPFLLDMLFTFNIALALVILLAAVYVDRPLDFSVFPTMLLIATLLRLALNIASTRIILLQGHTGTAAAGDVIEAFGEFVVGGNYAVGFVVFAILVIINFVVVTKGAGRISEVSARFTLDAMPGKQMAIDADLNAGLITQEEAQARRGDVVQEADFYGSMDGASKFVRGDAIAGILILFINVIGGFTIGMLQHDMLFDDAVRNYTLLTVGDGLVAQLPSLVLSTAAAIIVTRESKSSTSAEGGSRVFNQLFSNPRTLGVTGAVIGVMGVIPGMPNIPFLTLAIAAGAGAYFISKKQKALALSSALPAEAELPASEPTKDLSWEDVVPVDLVGLEVGYRLIPLVDKSQGGQLMTRIKGVRKKLTIELGFLVPAVHIRDNLELNPNAYRITLHGVPVGEADIYPDRDMAINPGQVFGTLQGAATKDPAFGLDAVWIDPMQKDHAQTLGYTVVDASTVVATHLSQILQSNSAELLGREETQQLLDNLAKTAPKLIEDLVPNSLPVATVQKVLQELLQEQVSIRDIRTIAESLAEHSQVSQDASVLVSAVRMSLSRSIVQGIVGMEEEIPVITLDVSLEHILQQSVQVSTEASAGLEPGLAEKLLSSLQETAQRQEMAGQVAVLLVSPVIRNMLAQFTRRSIPNLFVLSFNEIPDSRQIKVVSTVGQ